MLGLCSVTFREKTADEVIDIVKQSPLKTIEWWGKGHLLPGDIEEAKRLSLLMKDNNLIPSSYGSYYRVGTHEDFQKIIDTTLALGAHTIRVWAGERSSADVDSEYFGRMIDDVYRISKLAKLSGIKIGFEYHLNTMTDSVASTKLLMHSLSELDNVGLYWQPGENQSFQERLASIIELKDWITNVHVFHWKDYENRYLLSDGKNDWIQYINAVERLSKNPHNYLMEFVKDSSDESFIHDSHVLYDIYRNR